MRREIILICTFCASALFACSDDGGSADDGPTECIGGEFCPGDLTCVNGLCVEPGAEGGTGDSDPSGPGDGDPGDGDPGDGDPGDGDPGDGDPGDGDPGDGDGDPGDGDGDPGDGDGDPGDGDGDPAGLCGWDAGAGWYACGGSGVDPGGTHPIDCPGGLDEGQPCASVSPPLDQFGCCEGDLNYYCVDNNGIPVIAFEGCV